MKIKKITLQNNPFFGNAEFNFIGNGGQIMDNIVLAGENGCGKTQLLNLIYAFSAFSVHGNTRNEKQIFTIVLSEAELLKINESLSKNDRLKSPTGELEITKDFQKPIGWERFKINYQCKSEDSTFHTENMTEPHTLLRNQIFINLFLSIFSTVEINYRPGDTSTVTSKDIDEDVSGSVQSGNDLASEIQQLFIDIQDNDAHELQVWVNEHIGVAPPESIINKRISRFKNAFAQIFGNLNFSRIATEEGKKKVYFKKGGIEVDIASLSSGEKQIVFRGAFLLRNQQSAKGAIILIDEPEISLHPTWQAKIYDYYRNLFAETDGTQTSQMFIATHSQYVLHSALENYSNTLIMLLHHNGANVEVKKITAPLVLPAVTSAELNYVAFNIVSNDYHIELYGHLQNKAALSLGVAECSVKSCDTYITNQAEYDAAKHYKHSSHITAHGTTTYDTLPTYIRNAIDHPDPARTFTQKELRTSIELLIELCR